MFKFIKRVFITLIIIVIGVCMFEVYVGYDMYAKAIKEMSVVEMASVVKEKDEYTTIEELPSFYIDAVISVEDKRFYEHSGIDIFAIGRALVADIKAHDFVAGGSTITQQLAKNTYFTQEKKIERKIAEVFMAYEFEKSFSKNEILELYLNTSYFGEGCYTVSEACNFYFHKEPMEMTRYESSLLAGVPNAPSVYAPTVNPELASQRQKQVLDRMVECEKISKEDAQEILSDK